MNQKFTTVFRIVLPAILIGELALVSPVSAGVISNHSGTICTNYNAKDVTKIDRYSYGTRSLKTSATTVVCPLTRNTSSSYGAYVYVDIYHASYATTKCTAFSYDEDGYLLTSTSAGWTGGGLHEFSLNLTGLGSSSSFSDYSVVCSIPGGGAGIIQGVDLSEQ
ncbi:MAG: hypothetical protein EPN89_16465 [Methylovulum sp.]|nr:MAG: hypothetical protein EPN89_16465 [Methylovulum sp.]